MGEREAVDAAVPESVEGAEGDSEGVGAGVGVRVGDALGDEPAEGEGEKGAHCSTMAVPPSSGAVVGAPPPTKVTGEATVTPSEAFT